MDVFATTRTENIAEKKKTKNQKSKERKRKRKKNLENRTNQNVEISFNGKCHGIAEAGSYVGPAVDLEESSQVDRARGEEITEKKTKSGKSNKTSMKKCTNQTNQNNEKCDAIAKSSSYVDSAVESLLRGSSREDRASNDSTENKRTAFEDEPLLELSNEERVLGDAGKENSHNETKKRKRKSRRRGDSKNKLESPKVDNVLTNVDEGKSLREKRKRCNSGSRATNKDGQVICDQENKCLEVEEVSTEITKEKKTPKVKQKRKNKSKARDKDGNTILDKENNCLEIPVDRRSCISASELCIKGEDLTVEPLLKESPDAKEVTTDIVNKQMNPEEKQSRKIESYDRNNNVKVILGEENKCLKISADRKSCIAASDIVNNQKTPEEKQRRKVESCYRDANVKVILREEDNCPQISADKKSCIAASVSPIKDVGSNVESVRQDSPVVDEPTTEIVKGKKSAVGKQRQKTKLTTKNKNKVEVPIIDPQDELLVNTINGKCSTKTEIGTLQGVDSRSKFPIDNVSSLAISGNDDLPNDFYQLPQRELTICSRRILLVLDVNGLLADIVMPAPKDRKSDINMWGRAIFKRPYCDDFLNFCFDTFDVGIWSSRTKKIIDKVVDYLLGERKQKLLFCWDMSHTTASNFRTLENKYKPLVCKGLRNLWEKRDPALPWEKGDYTESNTLLIDDSPYKALLNPMHTAIFPHSFTYKDQHDNSIGPGGELRVYLQNLAKTDDVRKYVEEHPFGQCAITEKSSSWDFYSKVINSLSKYN
ncbi:hypothetical protein Leryth_012830 [Lithospermum erythrorhizon]|nr:hypothetical protein Leryth_012830 [Lithospermum erythrorhizon]